MVIEGMQGIGRWDLKEIVELLEHSDDLQVL